MEYSHYLEILNVLFYRGQLLAQNSITCTPCQWVSKETQNAAHVVCGWWLPCASCFKPMEVESNVTRSSWKNLLLISMLSSSPTTSHQIMTNWLLCSSMDHAVSPLCSLSSLLRGVHVLLLDSTYLIGVEFDNTICVVKQVNSEIKSCFSQLHRMYKIRECNTKDAAANSMVPNLVTGELDYCDSLFYGLPDGVLSKLWNVRNSANNV